MIELGRDRLPTCERVPRTLVTDEASIIQLGPLLLARRVAKVIGSTVIRDVFADSLPGDLVQALVPSQPEV